MTRVTAQTRIHSAASDTRPPTGSARPFNPSGTGGLATRRRTRRLKAATSSEVATAVSTESTRQLRGAEDPRARRPRIRAGRRRTVARPTRVARRRPRRAPATRAWGAWASGSFAPEAASPAAATGAAGRDATTACAAAKWGTAAPRTRTVATERAKASAAACPPGSARIRRWTAAAVRRRNAIARLMTAASTTAGPTVSEGRPALPGLGYPEGGIATLCSRRRRGGRPRPSPAQSLAR